MEHILNGMFAAVLAVTPWAVVLIGALLWLRRAGRKRLSPRFFQLAFLLMALRLALPFDFSLPKAPVKAPMPTLVQQELEKAPPAMPEMRLEQKLPQAEEQPRPVPATMPAPAEVHRNWLPVLWLAGAAGFLSLRLAAYGAFCIRLAKKRRLADRQTQAAAEQQFGWPVRVYRVSGIQSPMLVGLGRPAVYLPEGGVRAENLPYVLAHEACHARRLDVPAQFLMMTAQAVHWFDPMVHWMARAARQDMERSCDEAVLAGRDLSYRQAYGSAVLAGLKTVRRERALTLSTGFSAGKDLKRRFQEMFELNKKSKGLPLLAALAALVAAGSILVSCGAPKPETFAETSSAVPAFVESTSKDAESEAESRPQKEPENQPEEPAEGKEDAGKAQPEVLELPAGNAELPQPETAFVWPLDETESDCEVSRKMENYHKGIDIKAPEETAIRAMQDGTVKTAGFHYSYGNRVELEGADGFSTLYAHCKELKVKEGDAVKAGDVIATVGHTGNSTGSHLHLEVLKDGSLLQPAGYLQAAAAASDVLPKEVKEKFVFTGGELHGQPARTETPAENS